MTPVLDGRHVGVERLPLVRDDHDASFVYTPDATFAGSDSFTYVANDGEFDSNVAVVGVGANTGGGKGGSGDTGGSKGGGGKGGKPTKITSDATAVADHSSPAANALASYDPAAELRSHIQADQLLPVMVESQDRDETETDWAEDNQENVIPETATLLAASENSDGASPSLNGPSTEAADELYALQVTEGDDTTRDSFTFDVADADDLVEP